MTNETISPLLIAIGMLAIISLTILSLYPEITLNIYNLDSECDPFLESYYAEDQLLKGKDPGDSCGGLYYAIDQLWYECNHGSHQTNLTWLESIRLKYNFNDIHSFLLINYTNPCPISPTLEYLGTGNITDFTPSSYKGPAYSITIIQYNSTNHTFNNCRWNPYPYNKSHLTHIFKQKGCAWWNQFKEAALYDATIYPSKPEQVNVSWAEYQIAYQKYLTNGGLDI